MRSRLSLIVLLGGLCAAASGPAVQGPVTAAALPSLDAFWPYRVALVEAWQPAGRSEPLRAGTRGILIRVEPDGTARIDFSSMGKYEVPIDKTDLVQNADRIRRGKLAKSGPNFTRAIETHLVDAAGPRLAGLPPQASGRRAGFLCVFVDPGRDDFEALAASLAPLQDRQDVMTILFPQGEHPDAGMRERLRSLGWTVPFVYDFLSEPYTSTLLAAGSPMPALLLQNSEGRVVFQGRWSPGIVPELTSALDRAFGEAEHGTTGATSGPSR